MTDSRARADSAEVSGKVSRRTTSVGGNRLSAIKTPQQRAVRPAGDAAPCPASPVFPRADPGDYDTTARKLTIALQMSSHRRSELKSSMCVCGEYKWESYRGWRWQNIQFSTTTNEAWKGDETNLEIVTQTA